MISLEVDVLRGLCCSCPALRRRYNSAAFSAISASFTFCIRWKTSWRFRSPTLWTVTDGQAKIACSTSDKHGHTSWIYAASSKGVTPFYRSSSCSSACNERRGTYNSSQISKLSVLPFIEEGMQDCQTPCILADLTMYTSARNKLLTLWPKNF